MSRFALSGAAVVTDGDVRPDCRIVIEGSTIRALDQSMHEGVDETIELDGGYLVPGFIDIQVNGGGGILFNDDVSISAIETIAQAHRQFGTTALLPTLISDSSEKIAQAIEAVDRAIDEGVPGIVGLHLEGPYLNPAKRGIHDAAKIAALDEAALAWLTRPGRGIRVVTLAPELCPPGAIKRLKEAGVIVCAGHSMASYEETRVALSEGLDGFTHLFNAMTPFGSREPGMVGAALEDRRTRCGLIADGHHVHPAAMRVALAARGVEGIILVTDAMPPVGSDGREFMLGATPIRSAEGALTGPDGTLAGSALDMATAFRNACTMLYQDLVPASRLASSNAAEFLGIANERGRIAPGLIADLVHLSPDLEVERVWVAGKEC